MKNTKFDKNEAQKKIESAGVNRNTERAKKACEASFTDFVKSKLGENHEDIFTDTILLENLLIEFFDTYRLNDDRLPSRSTLDQTKSNIKGYIKRVTRNKLDISDEASFPNFTRLLKAKIAELKRNGRGDRNHTQPIPDSVLEKVFQLLKVLTQLMQTDESRPFFDELLEELHPDYRENYNKLVLHGAIFVFIFCVSFYFFH